MAFRARLTAGFLLAVGCLIGSTPAAAAGTSWSSMAKVAGIFDIGGPRKDGWLVVAGAGKLYLVDAKGGAVTPYAQGAGGYADDKGAEAYLTVSPGLSGPGCQFAAGDVYVLRLHAPLGVTRVDVQGHASLFAKIPGVAGLNGIAFDTVGGFGNRLLVTSPAAGKTVVSAIDCAGTVQTITRAAPRVEGGIEVAPKSFAPFGGMLIAPDEIGGNILAIAPDGSSRVVARSGLPVGGDIGVESAGFVPAGLTPDSDVFYSDRSTPGGAHPGSNSLLRLHGSDLQAAGVASGDLLVATEGGASMLWVRCSGTCTQGTVVGTPTRAHGEGHIAFRVPQAPARPSPTVTPRAATPARASASGIPVAVIAAIIVAVAVVAVGAALVLRAGNLRRRR